MKKYIALVIVLVMVCSLFVACSAKEPAATSEAQETQVQETQDASPAETASDTATVTESTEQDMDPIEFKFGCAESESTAFVQNLKAAFDNITEYTNGALTFTVFPDNQLGTITDVLEQVKSGAAIIQNIGFDQIGDMVPEFAPTSFPYVFQDMYELYDLTESDWMADMDTKISETGVSMLTYGATGYRHFISTKRIESAEDITDKIIRMGPSSAAQGFITVMGGTPTTSTWSDNYSLLQTGVFDACEASAESLWAASLQEVCSTLTLSGHFITPAALAINNDYWNKIPADYQEYIKTELKNAMIASTDASIANEESFIQKFKDAGVEVIEPDKSTFAAFVPDLFELLDIDTSVYDDIRAAIEENK